MATKLPQADPSRTIGALDGWLSRLLVSREPEARLLSLALLTRQHGVLIGPPGNGKSVLVEAALAAVTGARVFVHQCSPYTNRDEIEGPTSLAALKRDKVERDHAGKLFASELAYLDELFRAPDEVRSVALSALNERRDPTGRPIPLWSALCASNDPPREGLASAFGDRILWRCWSPAIGADKLGELLAGRAQPVEPAPAVSLDELKAAHADVAAVKLPKEVLAMAAKVAKELPALKVNVSDRRWCWALADRDHAGRAVASAVKAAAWLSGRSDATVHDLRCLQWILWSELEQAPAVATLLDRLLPPPDVELSNLMRLADEAVQAAKTTKPTSLKVIRVAAGSLDRISLQVKKLDGIDEATKMRALAELNGKQGEVFALAAVDAGAAT